MALSAWSFMQSSRAVLDPELHWAASQRDSAANTAIRQPAEKAESTEARDDREYRQQRFSDDSC